MNIKLHFWLPHFQRPPSPFPRPTEALPFAIVDNVH